MNNLLVYCRDNWERLLFVAGSASLVAVVASWALGWDQKNGTDITSKSVPAAESRIQQRYAFDFRSNPGDFVIGEPHPFSVTMPAKPKREKTRPWHDKRPDVQEDAQDSAEKQGKNGGKDDEPKKADEQKPPEKKPPEKNPEPPKKNGANGNKPDKKPAPPEPVPKVKVSYLGWMKTPSGEVRILVRYPDEGVERFYAPDEKLKDALRITDFDKHGMNVQCPDGSTQPVGKGETMELPLE